MKIEFDDVPMISILKSETGIEVYISNQYGDDQIITLKGDKPIKVLLENKFIEV